MKSILRSPAGLFAFSLALNGVAMLGLALPFQWLWNFALVGALNVGHLNYLQAAALLGLVLILKMAVVGVHLTTTGNR